MAKRGRLSNAEKKKIVSLSDKYDVVEIAKRLDRTPEMITEWIELNKRPSDATSPEGFQTAIRQELRHSLAWKNLQKEFTKEELEFFEEEFLKMMRQFKDDVTASEEHQIFDFVKASILQARCLQRQNQTRKSIEETRAEVRKIKEKYESMDQMDKETRDLVVSLRNNITFLEGAEQSHINEYTKIMKDKGTLMDALSSTRKQRVKDSDTQTKFIDLVKYFQKRDTQERESRHMEIVRLGTAKEFKRLTKEHVYLDGVSDLPILSAETADEFEKNAKSDEELINANTSKERNDV